jgi:hypothetical protein
MNCNYIINKGFLIESFNEYYDLTEEIDLE